MGYRFLCDATVHKLAKWLRFLGQDTEYTNEYQPYTILKMAYKEGRIILTRNRGFSIFSGGRVHILKSDFLFEQLRDVITRFNLKDPDILSRCSMCNTELINIKRDEVRGRVPYYTFKNAKGFKICPRCNKIYWLGSHVDLMINRLKKEGIWELMF